MRYILVLHFNVEPALGKSEASQCKFKAYCSGRSPPSFRPWYYIVDRLLGAAELCLDGDGGDLVRIERTDGVARPN